MPSTSADVVVIGGGIVGLATARAVANKYPGRSVIVVEKEASIAQHQTGRNSGVIHSGIYYKPNSLKAQMCIRGNASMVQLARDYGVAHQICGKLIVATDVSELERLDQLAVRAEQHGLAAEKLGPQGIADYEPHAAGLAALRIPTTGIIDYVAIADLLAKLAGDLGVEVWTSTRVESIQTSGSQRIVETTRGPIHASHVVSCAGLQSDRIAKLSGATVDSRIVPFRGEYYSLTQTAQSLVNGLIYPVPDPSFPFLGVHLTKMIDGHVHAGPNAVLALAREGYNWRTISPRDLMDVVSFPGFWRLAKKHYRTGAGEVARSLSKKRFLKSLQRLVPALGIDDLVPDRAGVRAQALTREGGLVDDFLIVQQPGATHVCNAPSPAATSSLEIADYIADRVQLH